MVVPQSGTECLHVALWLYHKVARSVYRNDFFSGGVITLTMNEYRSVCVVDILFDNRNDAILYLPVKKKDSDERVNVLVCDILKQIMLVI